MLCFRCATIIDINDYECPNCGGSIDIKIYNKIITKINQYILFGYSYRKAYEKQYVENGRIDRKFCLIELSDAYAWVGLAVLGGIIGGASWDFVKLLTKKIAGQTNNDKLQQLVSDETSLKLFSGYLLDYHRSFASVKGEVRDAIYEEMRTHTATEQKSVINIDFDDKEKVMDFLIDCSKKAGEKHRKSKISASVVKNLWDKTNISIE